MRSPTFLLLLLPLAARAQAPLLHALSSPNAERSGRFGNAVSGVPDADGDGAPDLLVGAQYEDIDAEPDPYGNRGRAYLYSGATGALLHTLVATVGGAFSSSVSGVPDTDGDGRGDLLIGAFYENSGALDAGRAYLYSGATGELLHTLSSPSSVAEQFGYFGYAVSGADDVDGDGRGDLLIGANGEDGGPEIGGAGRAHLFSGASGALLHTLMSPYPEANFSGNFGRSVSGVPDADGDGVPDLLVGASSEDGGAPGAGRAYLFSGASGILLRVLTTPYSGDDGCCFGVSVAGAADVNGDGRGDLLVGAHREASYAGRAYVFSGATGGLLYTLQTTDRGEFGYAVSGVNDADGDNRGDLLIGARTANVAGIETAGRAYLFSGGAYPPPPVALTLTPTDPPRPLVVPQGGRARFTATFDVAPDGPSEVEFWTVATRPDGSVTGPLIGPSTLLVTPGTTVTLALQQGVGASSLLGLYTYAMYMGRYPDVVLDLEAELATVVAGAAGGGADEEWRAYDGSGTPLEAGTVLDLRAPSDAPSGPPGAFALRGPSPNPAASRASLAFALAEPAEVRLALHDVLGREVAIVAAGGLEPGPHQLGLDVSALPAGVYVWRLAAGARIETGRLTVAR